MDTKKQDTYIYKNKYKIILLAVISVLGLFFLLTLDSYSNLNKVDIDEVTDKYYKNLDARLSSIRGEGLINKPDLINKFKTIDYMYSVGIIQTDPYTFKYKGLDCSDCLSAREEYLILLPF